MTHITWHADAATLIGYLEGDLTEAYACSVEAHLMACEQCRLQLADTAGVRHVNGSERESRHESTWGRVLDEVDLPSAGPVMRLLSRWVPEHELRPILAAPALRNAGCAVGLALLAIATLVAELRPTSGATLFIVTAPVVPLVGVALAYSHPDELCGEIADALPYSRFRLLLARTTAVLGLTLPLMALLSIALPIDLSTAMLWLAPSLALCSLTLALSSLVDARIVAGLLVVLWVVVTTDTWRGTSMRIEVHTLLDRSLPFQPAGQLLLLCVAVVATAAAVLGRSNYELRRTA